MNAAVRRGLVFTRDQVRRVDQEAIDRYAIPSILLMENASRHLARQAVAMREDGAVLILCGGGNNGGDGLAMARHLHNQHVAVTVVLTKAPEAYKGDAGANLAICRAMGLQIIEAAPEPLKTLQGLEPHGLIVDGLLGTGLRSEVREPLDQVVGWINQQGASVLAIDIPSGLDCDTGEPLGCAVEADATVTFVGVKRGFLEGVASRYVGEVIVGDIGAPRELVEHLGEQRPLPDFLRCRDSNL